MRSLFNICLSYVGQHLTSFQSVGLLPSQCKELVLEWLCAHDQLSDVRIVQLVDNHRFLHGLTCLNLYLSEFVNDNLLISFGRLNSKFDQIAIVYCNKVTDVGVYALTKNQRRLRVLELRGLSNITANALLGVSTDQLTSVDLSDCVSVNSVGLVQFVQRNQNIEKLYINNCQSVDDVGIYGVADCLGCKLRVLEINFLANLSDPITLLTYVLRVCPNLLDLSLCRYFQPMSTVENLSIFCSIAGCANLKELDLYGNYFHMLPALPENITTLRLSCSGLENAQNFTTGLQNLHKLTSISLLLENLEDDSCYAVDCVNGFLEFFLLKFGRILTNLQIQVAQLYDINLRLILDFCFNLTSFSLSSIHVSSGLLNQLFKERSQFLKMLKLYNIRLPYRIVCGIAKHCKNLEELEVSWMDSVDDRFLKLLANNCQKLKKLNINGCRWVTDKGVCELARYCPLQEIRLRATTVTDKCVYSLAEHCNQLQWVSHADYTGKPKFSADALKILRNCCVQRVVC